MINVGTTLKSLREERGYTVRQLAEKAQVQSSHLSNIENGKRSPGLDVIDRICNALGASVTQVLVKTDMEKELELGKRKLLRDLMPYFRKMDSVAKQIYGGDNNDPDDRDDLNRGQGEGLNPIIVGGGMIDFEHLNNKDYEKGI